MLHLLAFLAIEVSGRVTDARSAEPLERVEIRGGDTRAVTDADGRYRVSAAEGAVLKATLVGYRPLEQRITNGVAHVDFNLHPDTLRQKESVTVAAGPFDVTPTGGFDLAGSELRNLGSVLADDPFRALQSLPGVGAYSDFQGQFTVRGASYERIGIYLDGVLLHQPFHAVQGDNNTSASLGMLQSELLESAALEAGPLAPRYGDRTAGAVDFRVREGDAQRRHVRANLSASSVALSAEGPLGRRFNWVAGVRKSYLQYIINRTADEPGLAFAFWDAQGKLTANLSTKQQFSLTLIRAHSGLDREAVRSRLGLNSLLRSGYDSTLAIATWRAAPISRFLTTQRFAWLAEDYRNDNRDQLPLAQNRYGERIWNADLSANWSPRVVTEGGWSWRRVHDDGAVDQIFAAGPRPLERYRGNAHRAGGYLQQTWSPGRALEFRVGGRLDSHSLSSGSVAVPFAAVALPLPYQLKISAFWGQSAQFAELRQYLSPLPRGLRAERAQHTQIVLERPLGERSRLRFELFERRDRDLLFRSRSEARLSANNIVILPLNPAPWDNSLRGRARGWQAMWQRRSANGLTGWLAYTYNRTQMDERITGARLIADFDLRHQVQAFLSYRLRPTVNLSGRFSYAAGLPIAGFFELRNGDFFLSQQRNLLRLPGYQRTDLRLNKALIRKRFQATVFAEVVNLTNHRNTRVDDTRSFDVRTQRARLVFERTFPILPSAGVVFDF